MSDFQNTSVSELIKRLRSRSPQDGERDNHRMRRYAIERLEAAAKLEAMAKRVEDAKRDINTLLALVDFLEGCFAEGLEGEDAAVVAQIRKEWAQ